MKVMNVRLLILALMLAAACAPVMTVASEAADALPDEAALQAAGARIGEISIRTLQIFDLDDPRENKALYRLANRLHLRTRESVIRAYLLFASGDPYSAHVLQETERNLRSLRFLREPSVRATRAHDGVVDIEVVTHDVWTLQVGPSFGRSGGKNNSSFSFADQNFLGRGKTLILGAERDVDRDSQMIEWRDPSINGTRWQDVLYWSDTSDGHVRRLSVWRPFYALESRNSFGLLAGDSVLTDTRYALGESYDSLRHDNHAFELYTGWSGGLRNGRTRRLTAGWRVVSDAFRAQTATPDTIGTRAPLPRDRNFSYPFLRADWIRDDFQTTRDLELIQRTEDVQFGLSGSAVLGVVTRAAGSDRNATLLDTTGNYGRQLTDTQQLFVTMNFSSRIEAGRSMDQRASATGAWYWRHAPRLLAHAKLTLARGSALDLDHYYSLGGDTGLRGYPLRYQLGSGLTLLKLEERLYTGYSLWQLFDIGAAAFLDAGRVHGGNPLGAPARGWLKDVGVGLRLGNSRSSLGAVIHIDLATPLDRRDGVRALQWLVSTEATF
jgi:hypothetical protein